MQNKNNYIPDGSDTSESADASVVCGRNAVRELIKSDRTIEKIFVQKGERSGSVLPIIAEASKRGIPVTDTDKRRLDMLAGGGFHQGVIAITAQIEYCDIDDIIEKARSLGEYPLIVIADGIEDPRNLGALIRTAECAGAHGVIIPKRNSSPITSVVIKASAGACEHLLLAKVTNIASCVENLKEKGIWTYCAELGGEPYDKVDYDRPAAIVFGSEGKGVSRLVKEKCDYTVTIPIKGSVNSLNVSVSAGIVLYAAVASRSSKSGT